MSVIHKLSNNWLGEYMSEGAGSGTKRKWIKWADLEPAATEVFNVWVDGPERRWARRAWGFLFRARLTVYKNELERTRVLIRFLALAALYHSWCQAAFEEGEVSLAWWADEVHLSPFRVGQLVGGTFSQTDELDDDELMEASLLDLVREEYDKIVSVVTDGFGGNNQMFVSLWLSCNVRWSGKRKLPDEVIDETLNTLDENKLTGYEWVTTGCQIHLD